MNHVQVLIFPVLSFWCMVNPSGSQPHSMIQPSCIILGLSYLFLCHAGQVPLCCSQRQMVLLLVQANCGVHRHSGWACGALLLRSANVWPASDLVFSPYLFLFLGGPVTVCLLNFSSRCGGPSQNMAVPEHHLDGFSFDRVLAV
jgi:hypothetical protein